MLKNIFFKIDFLINHVKIHVIYVKKFLTKIDIDTCLPKLETVS